MPINVTRDTKAKFYFYFLIVIHLLISCRGDNGKEELEYKYYKLEKEGWKSTSISEDLGDVKCKATQVPVAYYVIKNIGSSDLIKVDSISNSHKRERIIEIDLESEGNKDFVDVVSANFSESQLIEYFSFGIVNDFYLISKNKKHKCKSVIYQSDGQKILKPKLLLFFSGVNPDEDCYLQYRDKLFNNGVLNFRFQKPIEKL